MNEEETAIRQRLKDDLPHYAQKCLKIRTKHGSIEPFIFNKSQIYAHQQLEKQKKETSKVRALILKARQQGMSTMIGARFYHHTTYSFGIQTFILAHESKATNNLYEMVHRYYEHTPSPVKPMISKSNAKELVFGKLDSGYRLGTSENKDIGRSSTIQLLHWSEVAFSKNTQHHAKGIMQAVSNEPGTEIILESTANGASGYFYTEWQKAEAGLSDFIAIFIPWFWQEEYQEPIDVNFLMTPDEYELAQLYELKPEQVFWRRKKIVQLSVNGSEGARAFSQEYPSNSTEAFQLSGENSFISSDVVMRARKCKDVEPYGSLLLGVDVARMGNDRSAIIRRQGRVAFGLETYVKKDLMELTGIVYSIILKENPAKVFVDVVGIGSGVYDRLRELLGDRARILVAVNAGAAPWDAKKYRNKRSEMWGELREWLDEVPCSIPDDDVLHADLCGTQFEFDSSGRLVMESKEHMKKRGVRSPDCSDALCLTFALPNSALIPNARDEVLELLNESFNTRMQAIDRSRK